MRWHAVPRAALGTHWASAAPREGKGWCGPNVKSQSCASGGLFASPPYVRIDLCSSVEEKFGVVTGMLPWGPEVTAVILCLSEGCAVTGHFPQGSRLVLKMLRIHENTTCENLFSLAVINQAL